MLVLETENNCKKFISLAEIRVNAGRARQGCDAPKVVR
jgi:hypothetical protein